MCLSWSLIIWQSVKWIDACHEKAHLPFQILFSEDNGWNSTRKIDERAHSDNLGSTPILQPQFSCWFHAESACWHKILLLWMLYGNLLSAFAFLWSHQYASRSVLRIDGASHGSLRMQRLVGKVWKALFVHSGWAAWTCVCGGTDGHWWNSPLTGVSIKYHRFHMVCCWCFL